MAQDNKVASVKGLFPLIFFLAIYMLTGVVSGNFTSMPLLVAFLISAGFALTLKIDGDKTSFDDKVMIFSRAGGEETIILMVIIFLLAGAFYSVADAMGAVSSIVNLGLSVLPSNMILPGIFAIGCILSFAMGTSMGTITALAPIGVGIVEQSGAGNGMMALMMGTVVGSAMFGDNLSFISDTSIAATRTQGVSPKAKFNANAIIILPAVIASLAILSMFPVEAGSAIAARDYSLINVLPYAVIIVTALLGWNVMTVLGTGIAAGAVIGLFNNSFSPVELLSVLQRGMGWMMDLSMIAIVVGGLVGIMKHYGGVEYLLSKVTAKVKSKIGAQFGISALVGLITATTTNNTISIITAGPLARDISKEFDVQPSRVAALLDIFSSAVQGLIPYGGQILLAAGLGKISPVAVVPYSFYPMLMIASGCIFILFVSGSSKNVKPAPVLQEV